MYCPQCGTDNLDSASFCRGCGANISLVPQALTGSLPASAPAETDDDDDDGRWRRRKGRKGPPSIERGIKNIFSGLAFLFVALSIRYFMPGGFAWWFWMLIPAFSMLGGGVAEIVRLKVEKPAALPAAPPSGVRPLMSAAERARSLPQRNTAELIPQPPSITEGTTRHLGAEMPTRHLETPVESKPNDV